MATDSSTPVAGTGWWSADSYIGCFISLISKSDIRYEGVIFHVNPNESTIALKDVRSFGTEGRKRDGPQVLPSDEVYEYIYFRGGDIKDLQVLSSQPIQSTPAIPNDPAIIQFHYLHSAPASASLPHVGTGSVTNFSSNARLELSDSTFQGCLPQYQPVENVGSWGLSLPSNVNGNEHAMPMYWQGFNGPSEGLSHLQPQSLLQPLPGLVMSPSGQQQLQYPDINASKPSVTSKFSEFPQPVLPPFSNGSLNSMSPSIPSLVLPSDLLNGSSASLVFDEAPNQMENREPTAHPIVTLSSSLPLVSPVTSSGLNTDATVSPIAVKPKSVLGSILPYQSRSTATPSIIGTSSLNHIEASVPSLVTPGQLLQPGPSKLFSSHSSQTVQKDIEVVQASTSESLSTDSKDVQTPILPLPSPSARKLNGVPLRSQHSDWGRGQGRRIGLHDAALHTHHTIRSHVQGRENKLNGDASQTHYINRVHVRGRRNGVYGATSRAHLSNQVHAREMKKMNGAASHRHNGNRDRAQGRVNKNSQSVTKFAEDFDFAAMNEKFNKDEIWGQLGKSKLSNKTQSKDKGDANNSDGVDLQHDDADGLPEVEIKSVYVKDDFFDSLSGNSLDYESGKGRVKFSEQMKLDTETFGNFQMNRGRARGGWSRGSKYGRGRGQGCSRTARSRVTK